MAEKGKRREKLEKRKTNLQPPFSGCKLWAFVTIKLGKKCTISAHEMRCAPYLYIVSLVVILSNWVCDNWVYQLPTTLSIISSFHAAISSRPCQNSP